MTINIDNQNNLTTEGVWTNFGGSKFKVAHTGNAKFQRALNRLQAPHRKAIEKGKLDPIEGKEIICQAMSEGLVVDWSGVTDKTGAEVKFDRTLCFTALKNNEDLREFIQEFATDLENFRTENIQSEGNG